MLKNTKNTNNNRLSEKYKKNEFYNKYLISSGSSVCITNIPRYNDWLELWLGGWGWVVGVVFLDIKKAEV